MECEISTPSKPANVVKPPPTSDTGNLRLTCRATIAQRIEDAVASRVAEAGELFTPLTLVVWTASIAVLVARPGCEFSSRLSTP